jgi:glycosyltransferase involved in cell wall biosynthesis
MLARVYGVVAYTEGAAAVLRRTADAITCADREFRLPQVSVIAHGVDTGLFFPAGAAWPVDRRPARRRAFPGRSELENAFLVLNANRNQQRKRLDLTLAGFAEFARGKPANVLLCLHSGNADDGWNLRELADDLGIGHRVLFTSPSDGLPEFSDARLRDIYMACDVGLNTSVAEGWGLVSFEHAATGAAQIVPRHTACEELWEDHAILLRTSRPLPTDDPYDEEQAVDGPGIASALDLLYRDPAERDRLSRLAARHAMDPRFSWDAIADHWAGYLREVLRHG